MFQERYITEQLLADLKHKMVFLAGPRQVGKTTLAKKILKGRKGYLNWDIPEDRDSILRNQLPLTDLYVFDELHKYRKWRNFLKGLYDKLGRTKKILVTGSAKLDQYRYGGDSLQGRYHFLRLLPLSAAELNIQTNKELEKLLQLGPFPEPYFAGSEKQARRWSREYRNRIINEEINSLEHILDLGSVELLAIRLPELVGSPLSINSLREDLQVSHKTVANWLNILERLYMIFRLSPFGAPKIRAVKKEQKHYFFDWTNIKEESIRFENMVALHLLKWVFYQQDVEGYDYELRYFRDIDGREVDFVITNNGKPIKFIEVKRKAVAVSKGIKYLKTRFPSAEAYQIYLFGDKEYQTAENIKVVSALSFLKDLV